MLSTQADQRLRHVLQNPCDTCDQSDLCLSGGPILPKDVGIILKAIGIHCPDPETHFGNRDDCAKAEMDYCRIGGAV